MMPDDSACTALQSPARSQPWHACKLAHQQATQAMPQRCYQPLRFGPCNTTDAPVQDAGRGRGGRARAVLLSSSHHWQIWDGKVGGGAGAERPDARVAGRPQMQRALEGDRGGRRCSRGWGTECCLQECRRECGARRVRGGMRERTDVAVPNVV